MFQIISLLSHQFSMEDQVFFFKHTLEATPRFYLRCLPVCHLKFLYDLRYCYATHVNIKINSPIGHLFAYNFFFFFNKRTTKIIQNENSPYCFWIQWINVTYFERSSFALFLKKKNSSFESYVQEALCHIQYYWRLWILLVETRKG